MSGVIDLGMGGQVGGHDRHAAGQVGIDFQRDIGAQDARRNQDIGRLQVIRNVAGTLLPQQP